LSCAVKQEAAGSYARISGVHPLQPKTGCVRLSIRWLRVRAPSASLRNVLRFNGLRKRHRLTAGGVFSFSERILCNWRATETLSQAALE
jgi:hypothetical protein